MFNTRLMVEVVIEGTSQTTDEHRTLVDSCIVHAMFTSGLACRTRIESESICTPYKN